MNQIHLPSGDVLRECETCGAAVLDLCQHQAWHAAQAERDEAAEADRISDTVKEYADKQE